MPLDLEKFIIPSELPSDGQTLKSSPIGPSDLWNFGFLDYNDLATATTPIIVPGTNALVTLTNDGLGPFTNKLYPPSGVTDVWDSTNDIFDFGDLSLGDMLDIRLDIDVTTTSTNQVFSIVLELAQGAGTYEIPWASDKLQKTAGTNKVNIYNGIYFGDLNTLDHPAQFKIKSDSAATVKVNGWYCKVIKKGF